MGGGAHLLQNFDSSGGQVGAYATYLSGGLVVDTSYNTHLYDIDANNVAFLSSIDGYRFGSFQGGPFLEPLATIEVMWSDIGGFSVDGIRVSFSDDANVRGRLGLRVGTTRQVWGETLIVRLRQGGCQLGDGLSSVGGTAGMRVAW